MKHRICACLLTTLLLICVLCACTSPLAGKELVLPYDREVVEITLPTYIHSACNCIGPSLHRDPVPFLAKQEDFESDTAPESLTVTFLGKDYTAAYQFSFVFPDYSTPFDQYYASDVAFCVESGTDRIFDISFIPGDALSAPDVEEPRAHAITLAEQMAQQLDIDISSRSMLVTESDETYRGENGDHPYTRYKITFATTLGGIPTTDRVTFSITSSGLCTGVRFGESGGFEGLATPSFDAQTVDDQVYSKLVSAGAKEQPELLLTDYEVVDRYLFRTSEGRLVVQSEVTLKWVSFQTMRPQERTYMLYTDLGIPAA